MKDGIYSHFAFGRRRKYWAEVPALAGCFSQGETVEGTLKNIREAIESHLIALKAEGKQFPKDQTMILSHVEI